MKFTLTIEGELSPSALANLQAFTSAANGGSVLTTTAAPVPQEKPAKAPKAEKPAPVETPKAETPVSSEAAENKVTLEQVRVTDLQPEQYGSFLTKVNAL
jgi:hypothetical protein